MIINNYFNALKHSSIRYCLHTSKRQRTFFSLALQYQDQGENSSWGIHSFLLNSQIKTEISTMSNQQNFHNNNYYTYYDGSSVSSSSAAAQKSLSAIKKTEFRMMTFHSNSNSAPVSKTKRDTANFACRSRHRWRVGSKRKENKWNISSTLCLLPLLVMIKLFARLNMLNSKCVEQ